MGAGYIPKIIVGTTKVNNTINSLLFKSGILLVNIFEYDPPKDIFWYIYMVYAAENTIEELANTPNKDDLSNTPYSDKNSPMKFKDSGAPQFARHNMKNNMANNGII